VLLFGFKSHFHLPEKPTWLSNGKIVNKVVDVFTNFTWECKAHGDPMPNYTWYSNASQIDTRRQVFQKLFFKASRGEYLFEKSPA
jgi:hypothetical protein